MKRECCDKEKRCIQGPRGYQGIRGERGLQGPRGPQGEVGPSGPGNIAYAQYRIYGQLDNVSLIPIISIGSVNVGDLTELVDTTVSGKDGVGVQLDAGYIYFVSFIISANLKDGGSFTEGYFEVTPTVNGAWIYADSQFGIGTPNSNGNASISGGLIINQAATANAVIAFLLSTSVEDDITVDGTVSIYPIAPGVV